MVPVFFLQNNMIERLTVPVAQYAREAQVALEDRSSTSELNVDDCGIDWSQYHPVLPYGSVQFLTKLKRSTLSRYVHLKDELFSARGWQASAVGDELLNRDGRVISVKDVPGELAGGRRLHIRPDTEHKAFNARVFDQAAWGVVHAERALNGDTACWVSPVQNIAGEWRCWFVGGQLVEVSQYRRGGQGHYERGAPDDIGRYAQSVADRFLPAPCVVMDVALAESGPRVIEFNPIHSAGWYAADVAAVLKVWLHWSCRYL